MRRWGIGGQLSPVFGLSVRYALTERFTVQGAGLPFLIGGETVVGGRLLYKLYKQPSYNYYVSGGSTFFLDTKNRDSRTGENEGTRVFSLLFGTLGGEYRFSGRLGLAGGLGLAYVPADDTPFTTGGSVAPILEVGLHYYF